MKPPRRNYPTTEAMIRQQDREAKLADAFQQRTDSILGLQTETSTEENCPICYGPHEATDCPIPPIAAPGVTLKEQCARELKASKLANRLVAHGISCEHAARMDSEQWKLAARAAKCNPPNTQQTKDLIFKKMKDAYARRQY